MDELVLTVIGIDPAPRDESNFAWYMDSIYHNRSDLERPVIVRELQSQDAVIRRGAMRLAVQMPDPGQEVDKILLAADQDPSDKDQREACALAMCRRGSDYFASVCQDALTGNEAERASAMKSLKLAAGAQIPSTYGTRLTAVKV